MRPSIKIIQDIRRPKNNSDTYPIKLRITFSKRQKYYPIGLYLTIEEFYCVQNQEANYKIHSASHERQIKEWKLTCDSITVKANKISSELSEFTFRLFDLRYQNKKEIIQDVCEIFIEVIDRFKINSKFGTTTVR